MSEPSILIVGGSETRRRGRPRSDREMSSVSTWIWAQHHDALVKMANQREVSVSALVRDILSKAVKK